MPRRVFLVFLLLLSSSCLLQAWGEPHLAITRAALAVLPPSQQAMLGAELKALGDDYCLIPDHVYTDKANARFATMEAHPGEVYLKQLHLPLPEQLENLATLRVFLQKAVTSWHEGRVGDAARYMGTLCHVLEDFGSPSHTIPGDNMFTLLQQFMPPSEAMQDTLLHSPVENGTFTVSIAGYQPRLLGVTVEEAAWHLLHRVHEGIISARSTTFPIIQALYAGDEAARVRWQLKAAQVDAQVVADAMHTVLCLGARQHEPAAAQALESVSLAPRWPVEALHLYYPQTQFFSSPYWGHAHAGVVLEGGTKAVPIRLRVQEAGALQERVFPEGISTGMGKSLTWHLPKGTFQRFTVLAGLQSGLGDKGRVEFTILADGQPLASATLNGTEPAHPFECEVKDTSQLQLLATGRGLDAKSNYAVWASPTLWKAATPRAKSAAAPN